MGWEPEAVRRPGLRGTNVAMAALQDHLAASETPRPCAIRPRPPGAGRAAAARGRWRMRCGWKWCALPSSQRRRTVTPVGAAAGGAGWRGFCAAVFHRRSAAGAPGAPMSPVQAAREACLGAAVPDEVGGALLRATGLYPPGSFVELANGERGIVAGGRANLPWVASLVAPRAGAGRTGAARHHRIALRGALGHAQRTGEGAAGS